MVVEEEVLGVRRAYYMRDNGGMRACYIMEMKDMYIFMYADGVIGALYKCKRFSTV